MALFTDSHVELMFVWEAGFYRKHGGDGQFSQSREGSHNQFITGNNDTYSNRRKENTLRQQTIIKVAISGLRHCTTTKPHAKLKGERS